MSSSTKIMPSFIGLEMRLGIAVKTKTTPSVILPTGLKMFHIEYSTTQNYVTAGIRLDLV